MTPFLPETAAGRFEMLMDLYAPVCEDGETGATYRDPEAGLITFEQFMTALHTTAGVD